MRPRESPDGTADPYAKRSARSLLIVTLMQDDDPEASRLAA
jgi:hypothetical protein